MFCHTILLVLFAISIALDILLGSSVISTTSAASIAASEPKPPIAIPTSARANTGASFIPSPTNAIFSFSVLPSYKSSNLSTFSLGSKFE